MKAILFSVIVLVAQLACAQVLVVSDIPDTPTLAPADCDCLICDCVDCDGNCGEAEAPLKLVSVRKPVVDEVPSEAAAKIDNIGDFLQGPPTQTNSNVTRDGQYRWVQTGTQPVITGYRTDCSTGPCKRVAVYEPRPVYGYKFFPHYRKPAVVTPAKNKSTSVPIKFTGGIAANDYAAPVPDGLEIDIAPTPTNSTGSAGGSGYYSVQGPYTGGYGNGNGCSGYASNGYGGNGGCAGGGSGGRGGILGRLFGGRRRG